MKLYIFLGSSWNSVQHQVFLRMMVVCYLHDFVADEETFDDWSESGRTDIGSCCNPAARHATTSTYRFNRRITS